jgi:hypothetical protein
LTPAIGLLLLAVIPGLAAQAERALPLFFFPNIGQTDSSIRFVAETPDMRAGFQSDAAILQIPGMNVRVHFAGANPGVAMEAAEPMPGNANFLLGDRPENWKTGVPTYHKIVYRGLYPGIDMTYGGVGRRLKSEFLVAPGADPAIIRLEYSGVDRISIDTNGDLVMKKLREEVPEIYQHGDNGRIPVKGGYRLFDDHTVGFEIGAYDTSRPLIIDPVISYATYMGGSSLGAVTALAVDAGGNLYATGWTEALDFPISGAVQVANQGGVDAFVVKLNPAGTSLVYATYIGGRGDDRGAGIAVDSLGQAYVTGSTASFNFPLSLPVRNSLGGSRAAFALKLNAIGNTLLYSTYLGGTTYDQGTAIAVDFSGNAYIAGDTQSADFPVLAASQTVLGGGMDAFVTRLTPSGAIWFSTFLGGASNEHAGGIAVDSSGNIYVAGGTFSTNFPIVGGFQGTNGGNQDAFVTKLNANSSAIVYSTYLGGNGGSPGTPEQINAIAIDASGSAYVTGVTNSTNFPVTSGAYQASFNGMTDAFVSKINPAGNGLVYSTYLGGTGYDWGAGIAVDGSGNAYAAGYTSSGDFPTVSPVQTGFNGLYDAFVSKLNAAGSALTFSTFYGGTGSDVANAIKLDANGNIFTGGQTSSLDLSLRTPIQSNNTGGSTGWLLELAAAAPPPIVPVANWVSPSSGSGGTVTFTAQFSDSGGAAALTTVALLVNTSASTSYACYVTYSPVSNLFALADNLALSSTSVIPGGGSAQNSQCTLNGIGSSASASGTSLTLTVSLAFQPGWPGSRSVFLYAADANSNTSFVMRGAWTVTIPAPQPSIGSVSPSGASGPGQTFTFVVNDTQTANNISAMAMLFGTSTTNFTSSCYIVYDAKRATVQLLWDSALGSDIRSITSTTILRNNQCTIGSVTFTISGLSLIVNASVTFSGPFSGLRNIYMFASEGAVNTGWVQAGTYNAAAGGVPTANSVVPTSGTGPSQRFSFTVSDQGGSNFITSLGMLFSTSLSAVGACSLVYDRTANVVSLAYDNPSNGAAPLTPGSNSVVSNSQCTLRGANTTVIAGVTSLTVTLDLAFNATFFGPKNTYLIASEVGFSSGWVTVGGWTVTGGAPTADSVTPSSGAGNASSFTFTVSDSANSANITGVVMLFTTGAPSNTTNACFLIYDLTGSTIGLYNDAATSLSTKAIGSSATMQNSQCAVGYTVMTNSGNSVFFAIEIAFKTPAFNGAKTIYLQANEPNTNSGFVSRGTWTVQ